MPDSAIDRLSSLWRRLEHRPGGKKLFSILLGRAVPYTGSVSPRVLELAPGHAKAQIRDRRRLRNHLSSIHALALGNIGELATGLAFTSGLPADARAIPVRLTIDYRKKARGTITAECSCDPPTDNREQEYEISADLSDESGDVVARVTARWRVGPKS